MGTPLYDALREYAARGTARFHTPGHGAHSDKMPFDLSLSLDATEIPGLDSLFEASGVIRDAENEAARFFGAQRTLFSSGGCTLCIQTMIALAAGGKKSGIFARNSHRSAVNTAALLGINPVWIYPSGGRIIPSALEEVLNKNPGAAFVYITSPDYFGRLCDVRSLSAICSKHKIPLIVDNAHGTHLIFAGLHPLTLGASITACSAHKTLPVLTGGAFLNIASKRYADSAKNIMSVFGSTSPSYLTMASLDAAREWCEQDGQKAYDFTKQQVDNTKSIAKNKGFLPLDGLCDPLRITFDSASVGYSGTGFADILRKNGIEPEYADARFCVLIPSLLHTEKEFDMLNDVLNKIKIKKPVEVESSYPLKAPDAVLSPREAVFAQNKKTVPTENAAGYISAEIFCLCPPGIPVVMPGEIIDNEICRLLLRNGCKYVTIIDK